MPDRSRKRPRDANQLAKYIVDLAAGEDPEPQKPDSPKDDGKDPAAKALGKKGGAARAAKMPPERRAEIARKAAAKRWAAKG